MASRNDWPCYASGLDFARPRNDGVPSGVHLPTYLNNGYGFCGQNAGVLGSKYDPWQIRQDPNGAGFQVESLSLPAGLTAETLQGRRALLDEIDLQHKSAEIRDDVPGWTIWHDGAEDGEASDAVAERADRVLARAAAALGSGPVVLVGHGHFSRVLGSRWLGLPVAFGGNLLLGTAAPSLLGAQYGVPVIHHWNLPNPAA